MWKRLVFLCCSHLVITAINISVVGAPGVFQIAGGHACGGNNLTRIGMCPGPQDRLPFGSCCVTLSTKTKPVMGCIASKFNTETCPWQTTEIPPSSTLPTTTDPIKLETTLVPDILNTTIPLTSQPTSAPSTTKLATTPTNFLVVALCVTGVLFVLTMVSLTVLWRRQQINTLQCPCVSEEISSPQISWYQSESTPTHLLHTISSDYCITCGVEETPSNQLIIDAWDNLPYCKPCFCQDFHASRYY